MVIPPSANSKMCCFVHYFFWIFFKDALVLLSRIAPACCCLTYTGSKCQYQRTLGRQARSLSPTFSSYLGRDSQLMSKVMGNIIFIISDSEHISIPCLSESLSELLQFDKYSNGLEDKTLSLLKDLVYNRCSLQSSF